MTELPEWAARAAIAVATAAMGAMSAIALWAMRLGNRVTALETRTESAEEAQRAAHQATMEGIREIRAETTAIMRDLSKTREEALHSFAEHDDLKRLEDKVDNLRADVVALRPPKSRNRNGSAHK